MINPSDRAVNPDLTALGTAKAILLQPRANRLIDHLANKNLRVCVGPNLHKDGRLVLRLNGLVSKGWDDECVHSAEIVKQVASLFRLDRKRSSIAGQELERD
jgi:hypothetical protein